MMVTKYQKQYKVNHFIKVVKKKIVILKTDDQPSVIILQVWTMCICKSTAVLSMGEFIKRKHQVQFLELLSSVNLLTLFELKVLYVACQTKHRHECLTV